MNDRDEERRAAGRFATMNAARFGGALLTLAGALNVRRGWVEPAEPVGYVLVGVGLALALLVPRLLARRWRSGGR